MTTNGVHPVSYQATCNFGNGLSKTDEALFNIVVEPLITDPDHLTDIYHAVGGTDARPIYNFNKYVQAAQNYDLNLHIGGFLHTNGVNGITATKNISPTANYLEVTVSTTNAAHANIYNAELVANIDLHEERFPLKIYIVDVTVT